MLPGRAANMRLVRPEGCRLLVGAIPRVVDDQAVT